MRHLLLATIALAFLSLFSACEQEEVEPVGFCGVGICEPIEPTQPSQTCDYRGSLIEKDCGWLLDTGSELFIMMGSYEEFTPIDGAEIDFGYEIPFCGTHPCLEENGVTNSIVLTCVEFVRKESN